VNEEAFDQRIRLCRDNERDLVNVFAGFVPVVGIGNPHRYRRHCPEQTPLYPVIEANLPAFLEYLHARDAALPRFVTDEFMNYLLNRTQSPRPPYTTSLGRRRVSGPHAKGASA
jgi:hypothetical protein